MSGEGGELIREALWFDDGFTTIPNAWARDARITHQARGLLVQIASHKAGFKISIASLVSGALNGRDAIQTILNELQRAGYLKRETFRDRGLKRYRYRLCDPHAPVDSAGQAKFDVDDSVARKPRSGPRPGSPYTGNPDTGNPFTENPDAKEEQLKNTSNGYLPDVTTEQPVDNSPAHRRDQGESEAQSATPDGSASGLTDADLTRWRCPMRRNSQPHEYPMHPYTQEPSDYCAHCGTRAPATAQSTGVHA